MGAKRLNPRLVKIHRNYTVEEIASLYGVHKNTVRAWIKAGLRATDNKRPLLVLGHDLAAFLQARRVKNKRHCQLHELYCLRCRQPREPAGRMAEFELVTNKTGNLIAICPTCESLMYKRVSIAKLPQICAQIDVTLPKALEHIRDSG